MKSIIEILLAAFLRKPSTTDAITSALTKTVSKLEAHADTTGTKADDALSKAAELVAAAAKLKEDADKARIVAANLGNLFK